MNEVYFQLWLLTSDIWSEVYPTGFYHDQLGESSGAGETMS